MEFFLGNSDHLIHNCQNGAKSFKLFSRKWKNLEKKHRSTGSEIRPGPAQSQNADKLNRKIR